MADQGVATQLIQYLGWGAGASGVALAALALLGPLARKHLEAWVTGPVKLGFDRALEDHKTQLGEQLAVRKAELDKELKRFEQTLAAGQREAAAFDSISVLEYLVLKEVGRLIPRISDVMDPEGRFAAMYSRPWDTNSLGIEDIDRNKLVTSVYRLMRFLGAYCIYGERSAGLHNHRNAGDLSWYVERKIAPVFASGDLLDDPVMLRDAMMEISEAMVERSSKWDSTRPLGFPIWVQECQRSGSVVGLFAKKLASMFAKPNPRLALLGIHLIDLQQDLEGRLLNEPLRNRLLDYLRATTPEGRISIWGMVPTDGQRDVTDLSVLDLKSDPKKVPRNVRSRHYDREKNPVGYRLRPISATADPGSARAERWWF